MTLEERLKLAREIAARTKPQFVSDDSRHELRCFIAAIGNKMQKGTAIRKQQHVVDATTRVTRP
jgi:hypothetical protein